MTEQEKEQYGAGWALGETAFERYFHEGIHDTLIQYGSRQERAREELGWVPRVPMFGGYGRAGKDEAALAISGENGLGYRYLGSLSTVGLPYIAKDLGIPEHLAFKERHKNRMFWRGWYDGLRKEDPALLAKLCLAVSDIVVGVRAKKELLACKAEGIVGVTFWIDRPGVPVDPTVEYGPEDCDFVLVNSYQTVEPWHAKVRAAMEFFS